MMTIPAKTIYPRTGDRQTVYLDAVVKNPNISVGAYTMYNDFVNDPVDFETNNVLYHYLSLIHISLHRHQVQRHRHRHGC